MDTDPSGRIPGAAAAMLQLTAAEAEDAGVEDVVTGMDMSMDDDAGVTNEPAAPHLRCPTETSADPRDALLPDAPKLLWVGFSIDVLMPQEVIDWMDERELEEAHFAWHLTRRWDELCGASFATGEGCEFAQSLQSQSLMRADAQQGAPGAGRAFLAMHRHMIHMLKGAFPGHAALLSSFTHVPLSQEDGQNPKPWRGVTWTPDNLQGFDILEHIEDHLEQFPDEDALGLYIESNVVWTAQDPILASGLPGAGVHAALHNQWAVANSPANLGRLDLALRNFIFWKLHGFIDDVWQRYRVAKGLHDDDASYVQLLDDECYGMHRLQPSHRLDIDEFSPHH